MVHLSFRFHPSLKTTHRQRMSNIIALEVSHSQGWGRGNQRTNQQPSIPVCLRQRPGERGVVVLERRPLSEQRNLVKLYTSGGHCRRCMRIQLTVAVRVTGTSLLQTREKQPYLSSWLKPVAQKCHQYNRLYLVVATLPSHPTQKAQPKHNWGTILILTRMGLVENQRVNLPVYNPKACTQ